MARILFLAVLVTPLIEIAGFVLVGRAIGVWGTLGLVLASAVAGALVLRIKGLSLLGDIRAAAQRGELPGRAIADAMMIGVAGVLLMLPGFFTDAIGLLLLLPPVRAGLYALLRSRVRVVETGPGHARAEFGQRRVDSDTIELESDEWRDR